jgi:hypothetical protein
LSKWRPARRRYVLTQTGGGSESGLDLAVLDEIYGAGDAHSTERLTGSDVTRRVRALGVVSRHGGSLPIVGCSGLEGLSKHLVAAQDAGQNLVWGKPLPKPDEMRRQLLGLGLRL